MSFPTYAEYKDSGIDWLGSAPSHWAVKRLRHVARLNPGKGDLRRLSPETEVTFLPMEAVGDDGSLDRGRTKPLGEVVDGYTYLRERDVAFAKITPCFENGKAALATDLKNELAFATTELTVLRPDTRMVSARYLYRLVTSRPFRELGEASMYGAGGQKRVPDNFARDFAIPLPPRDEQRQIADFLDHETARIDALIEEQQRLIGLLREKEQSLVSRAVTQGLDSNARKEESGIEWLGAAPAHWIIKRLRHVAILNPGKGKVRPLPADTEVTFLPMESVGEDGSLDRRKTRRLGEVLEGYTYIREGDVAFAKITPCFENGKAALVSDVRNGFAFATTELTVLRPDTRQVSARYLYRLMTSRPFREIGEASMYGAGGQKRVPDNFVRNFTIPLPPLDEQETIADFLDHKTGRLEALIEEQQKMITLLYERRAAVVSAGVTGKIDFRAWESRRNRTDPVASLNEARD